MDMKFFILFYFILFTYVVFMRTNLMYSFMKETNSKFWMLEMATESSVSLMMAAGLLMCFCF